MSRVRWKIANWTECEQLNTLLFMLFGTYTGQRSMATMFKLTVGQVREALQQDRPCVRVLSLQDKIKMEHCVPIHPILIEPLLEICEGKQNEDRFFEYNSIWMWMERQKIPMSQVPGHFVLGDLGSWYRQESCLAMLESLFPPLRRVTFRSLKNRW